MSAQETWDDIYLSGRPTREWPSEDVASFCARRLRPRDRVLDVGCGTGPNAWLLLHAGCEVVATDASQVALDRAKIKCLARSGHISQQPRFYRADLGHLTDGFAQREFAAIVDVRTSQHVSWLDHAAVYQEYYDMLAPGGWLFLLHLEYSTDDAACRWPENVITQTDQYSWSNINRGIYKNNGPVCMPPLAHLLDTLRDSRFLIGRKEAITRRFFDGDHQSWQNVCHVAIDAQRPHTS